MLPWPDAGLHHYADCVLREMRWRKIGGEASPARFRHQQRIKAGNPIMPLVVRQTRKESSYLPVGKTLFDDCFAHLQWCHARAFQPGRDGAEIAQAPIQRLASFMLRCSLTLDAHMVPGSLT